MKLTDQQQTEIFGINCASGKNYADDYNACIEQAEKLSQTKSWNEVKTEVRASLQEKYPK